MQRLLVAALVAIVACGHGQKTDGKGGGSGGQGGGSGDPPRADQPLTREDCLKMIDHSLLVIAEARRQQNPADPPTKEDLDKARKKMIDSQMDECLKLDRPTYQCVMSAETPQALQGCAEAPPPAK